MSTPAELVSSIQATAQGWFAAQVGGLGQDGLYTVDQVDGRWMVWVSQFIDPTVYAGQSWILNVPVPGTLTPLSYILQQPGFQQVWSFFWGTTTPPMSNWTVLKNWVDEQIVATLVAIIEDLTGATVTHLVTQEAGPGDHGNYTRQVIFWCATDQEQCAFVFSMTGWDQSWIEPVSGFVPSGNTIIVPSWPTTVQESIDTGSIAAQLGRIADRDVYVSLNHGQAMFSVQGGIITGG